MLKFNSYGKSRKKCSKSGLVLDFQKIANYLVYSTLRGCLQLTLGNVKHYLIKVVFNVTKILTVRINSKCILYCLASET